MKRKGYVLRSHLVKRWGLNTADMANWIASGIIKPPTKNIGKQIAYTEAEAEEVRKALYQHYLARAERFKK